MKNKNNSHKNLLKISKEILEIIEENEINELNFQEKIKILEFKFINLNNEINNIEKEIAEFKASFLNAIGKLKWRSQTRRN